MACFLSFPLQPTFKIENHLYDAVYVDRNSTWFKAPHTVYTLMGISSISVLTKAWWYNFPSLFKGKKIEVHRNSTIYVSSEISKKQSHFSNQIDPACRMAQPKEKKRKRDLPLNCLIGNQNFDNGFSRFITIVLTLLYYHHTWEKTLLPLKVIYWQRWVPGCELGNVDTNELDVILPSNNTCSSRIICELSAILIVLKYVSNPICLVFMTQSCSHSATSSFSFGEMGFTDKLDNKSRG